jgi:hypothetical protein
VKLGHVALDGANIKANASRHKAISDARMAELAKEVMCRGLRGAGVGGRGVVPGLNRFPIESAGWAPFSATFSGPE